MVLWWYEVGFLHILTLLMMFGLAGKGIAGICVQLLVSLFGLHITQSQPPNLLFDSIRKEAKYWICRRYGCWELSGGG